VCSSDLFAAYILGERGHAVEIAGDGHQALSMAQQNHYDVILMDVQMPGMDGLEATKAIRARENSQRRVPIIAMTAHAMKGDRERCLAGDMDDYLSKPIDGHQMIALIESLATGATPPAPTSTQAEPASGPAAVVFDHELALKRCVNSPTMLRDMIQCFRDEVDNLLPQMRAALRKGDLVEVGRLGHRMKGTVVYLGAEPARGAAIAVERFERLAGEQDEVERAVTALERECLVLKAAMGEHPRAAEPTSGG
jgi:CheY-like chemotaxis protein